MVQEHLLADAGSGFDRLSADSFFSAVMSGSALPVVSAANASAFELVPARDVIDQDRQDQLDRGEQQPEEY